MIKFAAPLAAALWLLPAGGAAEPVVRYVPLGDSYTWSHGLAAADKWPRLLVDALREEGVSIELGPLLARTGWTTSDLLVKELSYFALAQPTFSTLLIGVNDWVQGATAEEFRSRYRKLLSEVISRLGSA